ncbi:MAG: MotA/TolQ/ExbB proton channel family protein [Planctomycetota bacterium]
MKLLPRAVAAAIVLLTIDPVAAQENGASVAEPSFLTTLGELVFEGGILMIPIALASVLTVALAIERVIALRRSRVLPAGIWESVQEKLRADDVLAARKIVADEESALERVIHAGLFHWEDELRDVAAAVEDCGLREADDLQRNLPGLQGVASVAPLLGLLGTVVGMIQSFLQVAKQNAMGNPELLAEGIGQALVTTAAGLCVAIPALVLYYWFRGKLRRLVRELDDVNRGLLALHRRG